MVVLLTSTFHTGPYSMALPAQKGNSPLRRSFQAVKMGLQRSFILRVNTGQSLVAALGISCWRDLY